MASFGPKEANMTFIGPDLYSFNFEFAFLEKAKRFEATTGASIQLEFKKTNDPLLLEAIWDPLTQPHHPMQKYEEILCS